MLYEKNRKAKKLDPALFKNPTAEYRGAPFWAWNCELQEDELLRQIDIFKEMGLGGFHMHCRDGMSTTYLSDEFMALVRACVDRAKENGMLAWLYDEDKWPSGSAGGYVTREDTFRQRYITYTPDPNYAVPENAILLAKFDIVLDENKCLASYKKVVGDDETIKGTLWWVWREIAPNSAWFNNQAYIDALNKKAIEKFMEITHERYYQIVGEEFGKAVPSIFTDEPQFLDKQTLPFANSRASVKLPWTDDLEDTYRAAYGDSLIDHLPELLWDLPNDEVSLTRYRYHDHVSERFAQAFADTCGAWCDAHGIALTGHMMREDDLYQQTMAIGDCMRSYRGFSLPGIDMLCSEWNFATAKQCQSAVHQYGRPGMLSELYGVTGWDFDFRGHKLHGDWQAALGVTARVQHLSWVSMKGMAKRDYPASINYQSPWYREYRYVEDHFARVNTALTRGKPAVRIAVVHPVESYWLHWGPNEQTQLVRDKLNANFLNVTNWLLKGNIDFHFICESLLPDQCKIGGAPLQVGEMAYDVILVPECETLRASTLERLEAFRAAGGRLIFMGDAPKYEDARPSARGKALFDNSSCIAFSRGALLEALNENRVVEIRDASGALTDNLIHQLREDGNGLWLFVAHCCDPYNKDVATAQKVHIHVKGKFIPQLYDTITGEVKEIAHDNRSCDTLITMTLYDYDSALFFLEKTEKDSVLQEAPAPATLSMPRVPMTVAYTLSEPNALLLDQARYALDNEPLSENTEEVLRIDAIIRRRLGYQAAKPQPWVVPKKPAEHSVTVEFTVYSEFAYENPYLALEDAAISTILWNGEAVEGKAIGYYTDRSIEKVALPPLKQDENTLRVTFPFAERSNCEAMYLLGEFGVRVAGSALTVTPLPQTIGFSDLTYQGLPFYGGEVSYHIPMNCQEEVKASVTLPHYIAAVNTVSVNGEKRATVAYPPYTADIGTLPAGKNTVTVTAFISRRNCFGDVHNADEKHAWQGPDAWTTSGSKWTYEYRLRRTGLLSAPIFHKKND